MHSYGRAQHGDWSGQLQSPSCEDCRRVRPPGLLSTEPVYLLLDPGVTETLMRVICEAYIVETGSPQCRYRRRRPPPLVTKSEQPAVMPQRLRCREGLSRST